MAKALAEVTYFTLVKSKAKADIGQNLNKSSENLWK
jgi:hypothetical protein